MEDKREITRTLEEESLTRAEMQIEQDKLRLERERLLLERERLEAAQARGQTRGTIFPDAHGRLRVKLSTVIMVAIICALTGGILGALSTSSHLDRRRKARLQEVMQSLASSAPKAESASTTTNESATTESKLPPWLQVMTPQKIHSGVSVLVIQ